MKLWENTNCIKLLCAAVVLFGFTQTAAALTASNTTISNQAIVNYQVDGVDQSAIPSSPAGNNLPDGGVFTEFLVDNKVDLTVTCNTVNLNVTPGVEDNILEFTIQNTGNTTQGYALTVVSGATSIEMADVKIWYDTDGDGVVDPGERYTSGSGLNVMDVAAEGTLTIYLIADAPSGLDGALNGEVDTYHLVATTLNAGTDVATTATAGADTAGVDVVFADGIGTEAGSDTQYDGKYSASGTYTVASANLTVKKVSVVVEDTVNGDEDPKAIPGATVKYTITVTNSGSVAAENVTISDTIPANCVYVGGSMSIDGGVSFLTDISDADTGMYNGSAVSVTFPSIASDGDVTLEFRVTIN